MLCSSCSAWVTPSPPSRAYEVHSMGHTVKSSVHSCTADLRKVSALSYLEGLEATAHDKLLFRLNYFLNMS